MKIKIGSQEIDVQMYCYAKIGDTENLALRIDGKGHHDFTSVIDKISSILMDELDKEYENENN